ncbi:MAG: hypothetical protein NT009_09835 [Proteobacteria bacterium]|nr:hypothetical protein [Pseudomonadota bacterium]
MPTGRSTQLTKQVGEYLVSAELCRRGYISTTFTGNVPDFDILAINDKHKTIPIQVKTINAGSWQFDAAKYIDIGMMKNKTQKVKGKIKLFHPNLVFVLVMLGGQGKDVFYIMRSRDLQNSIFKHYRKYLKAKKGRRPMNPDSTHTAVLPHEIERFKDNWGLIEETFKKKRIRGQPLTLDIR